MDFRPRDGRLYAVGTTNRVYVIDPTARAATAVGPPFTPGVTENASGVDFDPVADQLRLLPGGNARENLVVDPGSGQVVRVATPVNQLSFFTGIAYDNAFFGATAATLYVHDCAIDHLGRVGSVGGSPQSADSGQFTDIGPLGFGTSLCDNVDLDISPGGTAYGLFDPGNVQGLYQVSLTTGSANLIGTLGAGGPFTDIAVAPVQTQIAFPSPTVTAFESDGTVDLAVQRTSSPSVGAATVHYATASGSAGSAWCWTP